MPTIPAIPAGEPNELLGGNRFDCRQRKWVPQVFYSTYTLYYCTPFTTVLYIHPLLLYPAKVGTPGALLYIYPLLLYCIGTILYYTGYEYIGTMYYIGTILCRL